VHVILWININMSAQHNCPTISGLVFQVEVQKKYYKSYRISRRSAYCVL